LAKDKLQEAFVYQRSISKHEYDEMRAKLTEDLTLAEMELRDAQAEEIEIEAVLDYAEMIILNASTCGKPHRQSKSNVCSRFYSLRELPIQMENIEPV
jgi:hypothetical protein